MTNNRLWTIIDERLHTEYKALKQSKANVNTLEGISNMLHDTIIELVEGDELGDFNSVQTMVISHILEPYSNGG